MDGPQKMIEIKDLYTDIEQRPGIYVFYRQERGFKFAYVGQSVNCQNRVLQHLNGYEQHIDLSIRKHKLFDEENNPYGYKVAIIEYIDECDELSDLLNKKEMAYCLQWANNGYQLRNTTSGSQDGDKFDINPRHDNRGYRQGVKDGEVKAKKFINKLLEKNLSFTIQGKTNKNKEKALQKLEAYLKNS